MLSAIPTQGPGILALRESVWSSKCTASWTLYTIMIMTCSPTVYVNNSTIMQLHDYTTLE